MISKSPQIKKERETEYCLNFNNLAIYSLNFIILCPKCEIWISFYEYLNQRVPVLLAYRLHIF